MPKISDEILFMGAVTAQTMHEMQNILAIIRESAGLMGDILNVNAKVDFKHRPNMERTLGHINHHVLRGKSLLEATSRLAHAPDEDMLDRCDLAVYARVVALLSERMIRLRKAKVAFEPASSAMPVAVGALPVLMLGYHAIQWAAGPDAHEGTVHVRLKPGTQWHALRIQPPEALSPNPAGLSFLHTITEQVQITYEQRELQLLFPVAN